MTAKFWMVMNRKYKRAGGSRPRRRHDSLGSATAEAARLAKLQPGTRFYILECLGVATTGTPRTGGEFGPVEVSELSDSIPAGA